MPVEFTILGRGKAGRALAAALGERVSLQSRDSEPEGVVLFALPDSVMQEYSVKFKGRCAHISGSLHIDGVPSLHPLVSFYGDAADWYGAPLAVTGQPPPPILDALVSLGFVPFDLPAHLKPLYHACAVLASGHLATLFTAATEILKSNGIALPGDGLSALAHAAINNAAKHGREGITGPFARGDRETIQRDLNALPEEWRGVFEEVGRHSGEKTKYLAHVRKLDSGEWDKPQSLEDHLRGTAELARGFASEFGSGEWGYALGMSHDTGKGTLEWQKYLLGSSGYDEETSSEAHGRVKHSGAGAKLVEEQFGERAGRFFSYCIAGHHSGLPDWTGSQAGLAFQMQQSSTKGIDEKFKQSLAGLVPKAPPWKLDPKKLDVSLWIRMLFSCLIDADRLNTEEYDKPEKSKERGGYSTISELSDRFEKKMAAITQRPDGLFDTRVYDARQKALADCRRAAEMESGFFSLTVPTGGGKTLSSMAFALGHAKRHAKRRIIYVIPYTSIIEQNAQVFRNVFGDEEILEHHSNIGEEDSTKRSRLAAENWDAPIIVTTTVQFFESLFAAKPGRCRKLHNIANSVVILDEAQLLPTDFLEPILETMRLLTEHYKVSFVICTATQPVLEKRNDFAGLPQGSVREIIQDVDGLYKDLQRVCVELPNDLSAPIEWDALAAELSKLDQVLCVVSDRKSCRELHALMPKGTYHLSALMCAEHRSIVISEIRDKLDKGENVRVVSTQLVEAGVDIDFPVVYRALAGLDSIAQAAGRCNREGKLNAKGELGRVVVFVPPRKVPPGTLRKAAETTEGMISGGVSDLSDRNLFTRFFSELYWKANSLDTKGIIKNYLAPDCPGGIIEGIQFREAAKQFSVVHDENQRSIIVPYGRGRELIDELRNSHGKNNKGPDRHLLRKLQRFTVNIYTNQFDVLIKRGSVKEINLGSGVFVLDNYTKTEYDERGLLLDESPNAPILV